jgi:hypothetical protein
MGRHRSETVITSSGKRLKLSFVTNMLISSSVSDIEKKHRELYGMIEGGFSIGRGGECAGNAKPKGGPQWPGRTSLGRIQASIYHMHIVLYYLYPNYGDRFNGIDKSVRKGKRQATTTRKESVLSAKRFHLAYLHKWRFSGNKVHLRGSVAFSGRKMTSVGLTARRFCLIWNLIRRLYGAMTRFHAIHNEYIL